MENQDAILDILNNSPLLSLATIDEQGPWICVLAYISDKEFNIYWVSDPTSRHQLALKTNPNCAISITSAKKPGDENKQLQMYGKVEEIQSSILNSQIMEIKKEVLMYIPRHEVQGFLEKWYKFTPEYIDITFEPEWAYGKRRYIIPNKN